MELGQWCATAVIVREGKHGSPGACKLRWIRSRDGKEKRWRIVQTSTGREAAVKLAATLRYAFGQREIVLRQKRPGHTKEKFGFTFETGQAGGHGALCGKGFRHIVTGVMPDCLAAQSALETGSVLMAVQVQGGQWQFAHELSHEQLVGLVGCTNELTMIVKPPFKGGAGAARLPTEAAGGARPPGTTEAAAGSDRPPATTEA